MDDLAIGLGEVDADVGHVGEIGSGEVGGVISEVVVALDGG